MALLDKLPDDGLVIIKHGITLARVMPYREGNRKLIGCLSDKIVIDGDLESTGLDLAADANSR